MSLNLDSAIALAKNVLADPGAWLVLLEIDTPALDEPLKLVRNTEDISWPEEKQDFEDNYTEVDPGADITVDGNDITFAGLPNNVDAYVYRDFTANYFDGDFEHQVDGAKIAASSGPNPIYTFVWALTNDIDDWKGLDDGSKNSIGVAFHTDFTVYKIYLFENDGGAVYTDNYFISLNTPYYLTIKRDESVGTYGTLYCYVYSDEARTTLLDTLTLTLHTSKKDYRYLFGLLSYNSASADSMTGEIKSIEIINRWTAFPFELDESKQSSDGMIQSVAVRVANPMRQIEKYVHEADGGADTTVTLRVVYSEELALTDAVLEEVFDVGPIRCTNDWVVFELQPDSFFTQRFPRDLFDRLKCKWQFKSRGCAYTGTVYSTCNQIMTDCIARGNISRFRATPAIPDGSFIEGGIVSSQAE